VSFAEDEFWEDVVGRAEIAERCGTTRAAVAGWSHRDPTFPVPRKRLHGTILWSWRDVEVWLREREQRPKQRQRATVPQSGPSS
jgi:hypothetical protein